MELAHMTDAKTATKTDAKTSHAKIVRERVAATQLRLLDGLDAILDNMKPAAPSPPLKVARRLVANQFRLWQFCDASRCRRSQCCRGEPRHCISIAIPLLPLNAIEQIIQRGQARDKRGARKG
jgi:hypothetical protein